MFRFFFIQASKPRCWTSHHYFIACLGFLYSLIVLYSVCSYLDYYSHYLITPLVKLSGYCSPIGGPRLPWEYSLSYLICTCLPQFEPSLLYDHISVKYKPANGSAHLTTRASCNKNIQKIIIVNYYNYDFFYFIKLYYI